MQTKWSSSTDNERAEKKDGIYVFGASTRREREKKERGRK